MSRPISLFLLASLAAFIPAESRYWQPTISPAPTETGIPSPSPSDVPTVSPAPTVTSKPTMTASLPPTSTRVPTESPTESPAPSPSPSDIPTNRPSSSPSMVPSSQPSYNPSSIPSDLPSLAPSHSPSDAPTGVPSFQPTLSQQPSSGPTDFPTVSSKKHSATVAYILDHVPGELPDQQLVAFTTVAKDVIQSSLDTPDTVDIEILYIRVKEQTFFSNEKPGRRALKKEDMGVLELKLEVTAAITPGDYIGFPEMMEELILDSKTDKKIDDELKKVEKFFEFGPNLLSGPGKKDDKDDKTFSNGAKVGIAFSCVAGIGLFIHQYRRKSGPGIGRIKGITSLTDDSDGGENNGDDSSGIAIVNASYVPNDWDTSSPRSTDGETKFTTSSTNAVVAGNVAAVKKRSFFGRKKEADSDDILDDLEEQKASSYSDIAEQSSSVAVLETEQTNPVVDSNIGAVKKRSFFGRKKNAALEEQSTSSDDIAEQGSSVAVLETEQNCNVAVLETEQSSGQADMETESFLSTESSDDNGDEQTAIETILG
eukprot:scaffold1231_cov107-Cylindrotheca_fusiformis.AAC.8